MTPETMHLSIPDFPAEIAAEAKALAARRRVTIKAWVLEAVRFYIAQPQPTSKTEADHE